MHIQATFNNTIVTITTESGDTISWKSCGAIEKMQESRHHMLQVK